MTTTIETPRIAPPPEPQRLVWHSTKSDTLLAKGRPMSADEAIAYASLGAANAHDFAQPAHNEIRWVSGFGNKCHYIGVLPMPDDLHGVVTDFERVLLDFPLGIRQGDLLVEAMRAAVDGLDPTPVLLQLVATTAIRVRPASCGHPADRTTFSSGELVCTACGMTIGAGA